MSVGAVVLAAGESSRFGSPKQRLLLPDVLERLSASPVSEITVVAGAHSLRDARLPETGAVPSRVVSCPEWELGPGASLRCGLAALDAACAAAIVVLADGPDLSAGSIRRVVKDWQDHGGSYVAASYGGVRGHPLLLARSAWGDVPNEGLRVIEPRLVPCDDLGSPGDVDTPADLPQRYR